jgi:hypothetical protein
MSPKDILMTGTDLSIFDHPELGKADLDFRALQRSLESRLPTRDGFENIHPIDTSGNFFYTQKFDPNQRHAVLCWSLISREALSIELGLVGDEARVPLALIREPKWGAGTYCPILSGSDERDVSKGTHSEVRYVVAKYRDVMSRRRSCVGQWRTLCCRRG